MDERVLGDVPSEGSDGGRSFGIYRAYSPEPKMHSISRVRVIFVAAIAAVVAFAVFFPMIQYAFRSSKTTDSLPYPEIANRSFSKGGSTSILNSPNCSTNFLSFGHDCTDIYPTPENDESNTFITNIDMSTLDVRRVEDSNDTQYDEDNSEIQLRLAESRDFKVQRLGRSKWLIESTPYPFFGLSKPTPIITERSEQDLTLQETNVFAIPSVINNNYSDYYKPRVNFTPPPYAFTPIPNFTNSYAQLSPYKAPTDYTKFENIIKYVNNNGRSDQHLTEEREIANHSPATTMRVSGIYRMPLDRRRPGEIIVSGSDNDEETKPFFNGHAYVADPFVKFRPANPLEINRLVTIKTSTDEGPRFRRPVSFVPTSSIAVDITPAFSPTNHDLETASSHTVAIFHPPAPVSQTPILRKPTTVLTKDKPISVTLDIYPVAMDVESGLAETTSVPSTPPWRGHGRLNPKLRPRPTERPRWRPQSSRKPSVGTTAKPASDNHMIVHLNLFPSKRKPYVFPRRGRGESTTQSGSKTTLLTGGHYLPRSSLQSRNSESSTEEDNRATISPLSSTWSVSRGDHPEYSALGSSSEGDEETATLFDSGSQQEKDGNNISEAEEQQGDEIIISEERNVVSNIEKTPQIDRVGGGETEVNFPAFSANEPEEFITRNSATAEHANSSALSTYD